MSMYSVITEKDALQQSFQEVKVWTQEAQNTFQQRYTGKYLNYTNFVILVKAWNEDYECK